MPNLTRVDHNAADVTTTKNYPEGELESQLEKWVSTACKLVITPETADILKSVADAGTKVKVSIKLEDTNGELLSFGRFTLGASIGDTTTPTATIDDTTPTMVDGEAVVTITLPAGTYNAQETVTLTIASFTAPDGRSLTGGTCVLTIIADPEG